MRRAARVGDAWKLSRVVCGRTQGARPRAELASWHRAPARRGGLLRPVGKPRRSTRSHARPRRRRDRDRGALLRRRGTDGRASRRWRSSSRSSGAWARRVAALHVQLGVRGAARRRHALAHADPLHRRALPQPARSARAPRASAPRLGPGTLLSAVLYAGLAVWLLDLPLPAGAILGAAVASTDQALLKGLLRRRDLPAAAAPRLRLSSGLGDVVLPPVVLVAMVFATGSRSRRLRAA